MGFWNNVKDKIDNYQYESAEKEKGKNLYLLNEPLPKDANILIIRGYEKAKVNEQNRKIKLRRMNEETERLKLQQKLNTEKLANTKIKNKRVG